MIAPPFEKKISIVLWVFLISALFLAALSASLITVEFDEAWILSGSQRVASANLLPQPNTPITTGGVHMIVVAFATYFGAAPVAVARIMSIVSLILSLIIIDKILKRCKFDRIERLVVIAVSMSAPGTVLLGGMGFGVMPAFFFFLFSIYIWICNTDHNWKSVAIIGISLGISAATRWTFIPLIPTIILLGLLSKKNRFYLTFKTIIGMCIAFIVFAAFVWAYINIAADTLETANSLEAGAGSAGITGSLPTSAQLISYVSKFSLLVPLPLIAATFLFAWVNPPLATSETLCFLRFLTAAALILFLAWVLRSPFQHIRYIWPSVFLLFLAFGILCARIYKIFVREQPKNIVLIFFAIVLSFPAQTYIAALRLIVAGAAEQINAAGQDNLQNHFKPLHLIKEQNLITEYISQNMEAGDKILAIGIPGEWSGMQLSLLAQRDIQPLENWPRGILPTHILVHRYSRIDTDGRNWLANNAVLLDEIVGYEIYRPINGSIPDQNILINNEIYHYSLPRSQSLTGY